MSKPAPTPPSGMLRCRTRDSSSRWGGALALQGTLTNAVVLMVVPRKFYGGVTEGWSFRLWWGNGCYPTSVRAAIPAVEVVEGLLETVSVRTLGFRKFRTSQRFRRTFHRGRFWPYRYMSVYSWFASDRCFEVVRSAADWQAGRRSPDASKYSGDRVSGFAFRR